MKLPRYPDAQESVARATARLTMLLCSASDERLAGMTAEGLAATHRVPLKECEYMLLMARQRRGL